MNYFKNLFPNTLLLLICCLPLFALSQNGQKSFDKDYNWNESNDTETVYIKVEKDADKLSMDFKGETTSGDLRITAFDPEGNKVAGFTLICSEGDNSHVHVHTSGGSGSNASSSSNSNSNSNSNVNVTTGGSGSASTVTTTTQTSSGASETKTKRKHKHKHKDKDKGEYTYEVSNSDSKGAKGVMKKKIKDPMPGQWKIVIETEEVTGTLEAKIDQD